MITNNQHFITDIHIRGIKDVHIPLSQTKMQHLILTGKNGSGKTSVIDILSDYFKKYQQSLKNLTNASLMLKKTEYDSHHDAREWRKLLQHSVTALHNILPDRINIKFCASNLLTLNYLIQNYNNKQSPDEACKKYIDNELIFVYFQDIRISHLKPWSGNAEFLNEKYDIVKKSTHFIDYLVHQKNQKAYAVSENKSPETIEQINKWFITFESLLKNIYEDEGLKLEFISKEYLFKIHSKGKIFLFNESQLSRGYSAIIAIISELMLQLSGSNFMGQGIVLIDEIDTHLHISLQKKILPILINLFPNIQFIVTTHSPFVLSSIDNAVVYDLENQMPLENLSAYSCEAIIENYFKNDQYSEIIKQKIKNYEILKLKEINKIINVTDQEILTNLTKELKQIEQYSSEYINDYIAILLKNHSCVEDNDKLELLKNDLKKIECSTSLFDTVNIIRDLKIRYGYF